jgi:hypothetical protein
MCGWIWTKFACKFELKNLSLWYKLIVKKNLNNGNDN